MKKFITYKKVWLALIAPALVIVTLVSCNDSPTKVTNSTAPPQLKRISLLNKDSTTVDGRRGGRYLLLGDHLQGTRSMMINGQSIYVNPPFVTNNNIVFQVPDSTPVLKSNVPDSLWDKLVVTTNKGSASKKFHIQVLPDIMDFQPEIGGKDTVVTISGKFFDGLKRVMVGDTKVKVLSSSESMIKVKIPDNNTQGKIAVVTSDGKSTTNTSFIVPQQIMYDDGLPPDWYANGYDDTEINLKNTNKEYILSGLYSLKVTINTAWDGFNIEDWDANRPIPLNGNNKIRLTVYRAKGAGSLYIDLNGNWDGGTSISLPEGKFKTFTIPISELGSPSSFKFLEIYSDVPTVPSVIYINDICLL